MTYLYKLWIKQKVFSVVHAYYTMNIVLVISGKIEIFSDFLLIISIWMLLWLVYLCLSSFRLRLVSASEWYLTIEVGGTVLWKFQPTFSFGYCVFTMYIMGVFAFAFVFH